METEEHSRFLFVGSERTTGSTRRQPSEESLRLRRERERQRRASETTEEREVRLSRRRLRDRARWEAESAEAREERLLQLSNSQQRRLASETTEQREQRLQQLVDNQQHRIAVETAEQREQRLQQLVDNQQHRIAVETAEQREQRLQQLVDNQQRRIAVETAEQRQQRLQQLVDNQQHRIAVETAEQREQCLQQLTDNWQHRLAVETAEQREQCLQQLTDNWQHRLAVETAEQREQCLQQLTDNWQHRIAVETAEQREQRLQQLTDNWQHRLAAETTQEREARLQQARESRRERQALDSNTELFYQPAVRLKMTKFHEELRSLQFIRCSTCLERFPGLKKKSNHIERVCFHQDKHIPANNMHPGVVPPQLQVSRTEFCDVVSVIVWSNTFIPSNIYTILYSTVAFNPRNITLFYTLLLQGLSQVEEMLISAVMPMMSIYRLPQGQFQWTCHQLAAGCYVICQWSTSTTLRPGCHSGEKGSSDQTHCDFRVRRAVVDQALQWLIAHNIYYRAQHVHIDLRRLWLVYHRMGVSLMSVLLH